jgi:hypothetical protein
MPTYGLGNFNYDLDVKDGNAIFKFSDPNDAANTAEITINQKDFPEGAPGADDRRVADQAFAEVSKKLNDTRDKRLEKEAADARAAETAQDQKDRAEAKEFFDNSSDVTTAPAKVEKDGTTVYNTAESSEAPSDDKKK